MTLKTIDEYAHFLAETFGSQLAAAVHQSSSTRLVVNITNGDARAVESIDQDYLPPDPLYVVVTEARNQSAVPMCYACSEDDAFTDWIEEAEFWDVDELAEEIRTKLLEAVVTDASVVAWKI